jgi:hypothetical protein
MAQLLASGLAQWHSGQTSPTDVAPLGALTHAVTTRSLTAVARPARAHRWMRCGGGGGASTMGAAAGAHPSGGSMVRCDGGGSTATFEAAEALRGSTVVVRQTCSTGEPRGR